MSKSLYTFKDDREFNYAIDWIIQKLEEKKMVIDKFGEDKELLESQISKLEIEIEELKTQISSNDGHLSIRDIDFEDAWEDFADIMTKRFKNQRQDSTVVWKQWQNDLNIKIDFGYKEGYFKDSVVTEGGLTKLNRYVMPPPKIIWQLKKIVQKGFIFYTATANVEQVEQVCSVPSLPPEISSTESGKRVLDRNRCQTEWQRRVDPKRIKSIEVFVGQNENIIANAAILYIKDKEATRIIEEGGKSFIEIDFSKFLRRREDGTYIDQLPNPKALKNDNENKFIDLRPLWLIDGQHRIRGLSRSMEGHELEVPLIIFPSEFSLSGAAKIFAEINTLQTKLEPLHTLFMRHRFQIPSPIKKYDYQKWEYDPRKNCDSRANSLAYEIAAKMASEPKSALLDQIQILEENRTKDLLFKADIWVTYARSWFFSGPYNEIDKHGKNNLDEIYTEVNNYFLAFIENCNHDEWEDGEERWSTSAYKRGLIQSKTHFQVLLEIFPLVYLKAKLINDEQSDVISITEFKKVLSPLKWVDWLNPDLKNAFGGGGEKGRSCLKVWIEDALEYEHSYDFERVMSDNIKSKPGKGILSPCQNSQIELESQIDWPSKRHSVILISKRPINAMRTSRWQILDHQGGDYSPANNAVGSHSNDFSRFKLHYSDWMKDVKHIDIRVDWMNAISPSGFSKKRLYNPRYQA